MVTIVIFSVFAVLLFIKGMAKWVKLLLSLLAGIASLFSGIESYVNIITELANEEYVNNAVFIDSLQKTRTCTNGLFTISTNGSDLEMNLFIFIQKVDLVKGNIILKNSYFMIKTLTNFALK